MYPRYRLLSRPQLVLALLSLFPLSSTAAGQTAIAGRSTPSPQTSVMQAPGSNAVTYPPDTMFLPSSLGTLWNLGYWTEYNPATCVDISPGTYTATTPAKYGVTLFYIADMTIVGGSCNGAVFPFNFGTYSWTATTAAVPQDFFSTLWTTPDGLYYEPRDWLAELIPQSETTAFNSWSPAHPTVGRWAQTLQLATVNYKGVRVRETDPGGEQEVCTGGNGTKAVCAPDTCYYPGSTHQPFIHITGSPNGWPVQKGNVWGLDSVGWGPTTVTYYRDKGRDPCSTSFPQQMQIQFATGDPAWYDYGNVNTLGYEIDETTVTSIRAGSSMTETWP